MLNADAPDLDLHLEAAKEFLKPQVQAIQQIDLNDESLSPAMRGTDLSLQELEAHLSKLLGIERLNGQQEFMLANAWVEGQLRNLVESLPDGPIKSELSQETISLKELLKVLRYCSSDTKEAFILRLLQNKTADETVGSFISDKLDNALHYLSPAEKGALVDSLLVAPSEQKGQLIAQVLRGCESLTELQLIINPSRVEKLLELSSTEVNEFVAHALITSKVRDITFPEGKNAEFGESELAALLSAYQAVHDICTSRERLSATTVVKDFLATISDDLSELEVDLARLEATPEAASTISDLLKRYAQAAKLEFRYGVNLSRGDSSYLSEDDGAEICRAEEFGVDMLAPTSIDQVPLATSGEWTLADLENVRAVLEALPEGDLLFTPLLREIERVPSLGWGVLGVRYAQGLIQIADSAVEHEGIKKNYEGVDSLKIVLTHEIGHGLQIGDGFSGIYYRGNGESTFGNGEEMVDFDEWSNLSDWVSYHRSRFEPGETYGTIKLDGQEYPLNKPTLVNGKEVVLLYDSDWNVLISYRADADFSNRWYARTNPWEDFAEAFSEYIFLPERLIRDAPEKFKHLDEEFKRYEGNVRLEKLLSEALSR